MISMYVSMYACMYVYARIWLRLRLWLWLRLWLRCGGRTKAGNQLQVSRAATHRLRVHPRGKPPVMFMNWLVGGCLGSCRGVAQCCDRNVRNDNFEGRVCGIHSSRAQVEKLYAVDVCAYIYIYIYIYMHIYIYRDSCDIYVRLYIYVYTYIYLYVHTCKHTHTHTYVLLMCVCVCVCVCVCTAGIEQEDMGFKRTWREMTEGCARVHCYNTRATQTDTHMCTYTHTKTFGYACVYTHHTHTNARTHAHRRQPSRARGAAPELHVGFWHSLRQGHGHGNVWFVFFSRPRVQ